jgi:Fe-S-cluster containining protein
MKIRKRSIVPFDYTTVKFTPVTCPEGCSNCCGHFVVHRVEKRAIEAYLISIGKPIPEVVPGMNKPLHGEGDDCVYLENDRCTIYPVRPFVCRAMGAVNDSRLICSRSRAEGLMSASEFNALMNKVKKA